MRRAIGTMGVVGAILIMLGGALIDAQGAAGGVVEPFKLGTFMINGKPTVGIVLRDSLIIDIQAANAELMLDPTVARVLLPDDMIGVISGYEYGVQRRLYEIVNQVVRRNLLAGARRSSWVYDVGKVRTLAPILYPSKILNAAVNYFGHVNEGASLEEHRRESEERRKNRGPVPYLFLKPSVGAVIGNGDDILVPKSRDRIDWECELAIVIGRPAKYITAAQAKDYIFGYTIELDMSDRGGRPPGDAFSNLGVDWLVGKGHDTFAPMGPYIVPKEFYGDPMNVRQLLTVNGKVRQDSRSSDMIHNVYKLVEYGASQLTLFPGDVIAAGSPAGTAGRLIAAGERPENVYLKAGDKVVATIDGIGTLTHTMRSDTPEVTSSASAK